MTLKNANTAKGLLDWANTSAGITTLAKGDASGLPTRRATKAVADLLKAVAADAEARAADETLKDRKERVQYLVGTARTVLKGKPTAVLPAVCEALRITLVDVPVHWDGCCWCISELEED